MKKIALVLLCMMVLLPGALLFAQGEKEDGKAAASDNLAASLAVDVSVLRANDGQPLIQLGADPVVVPERPADPLALPEDDPLHWWDMEFAGWNSVKKNLPVSPKDGAIGKKVIMIVHGDHPWTTACATGAQKVADAYHMDLKILSPNWDVAVQNQMIDQSINERPDMLLVIPLDANTAPQQARKINKAGVPLIMFNTLPSAEAMDYCIGWTGPDDFGQMRILAKLFADKLGKKGGITYIQHSPGGSPYFARCYGPISTLATYAPDIVTLDKQAPGFDADRSMQLTSDWITRFGDQLNGIFLADDSTQAVGAIEALDKAGRKDVVIVGAGNSKQGMDLIKEGKLFAITYQTAEGDGALAVATAADWFNGKEIEPVRYIPKKMITIENVDDFYPPQW